MTSPITDARLKADIARTLWLASADFPGKEAFWDGEMLEIDRAPYFERAQAVLALPAIAELIAAREALKFYAEPTNYKGELVQGGTKDGVHTLTHHVNLVRKDGGQLARSALSGNRSG